MDCKRVTVIRIGPVISTRMKSTTRKRVVLFCFICRSPYVPFHEKSVCRSPQAVTNAFYFTVRPDAF